MLTLTQIEPEANEINITFIVTMYILLFSKTLTISYVTLTVSPNDFLVSFDVE